MIVYFAENAERGQRWQPTQADANRVKNGGPIAQQTVAEGGRSMMCNLLNNCERPESSEPERMEDFEPIDCSPGSGNSPAEQHADISGYPGGYSRYESPFGARSCLAGMDSVALTNAIKQMDGTNLGRIINAACERLAVLNRGSAL